MPNVTKNPEQNWRDDLIQFARLIEELQGVGAFTPAVMKSLQTSMDLNAKEIQQLMRRAQKTWDRIKQLPDGQHPTIVVELFGGIVDNIRTNIPGMDGVEVVVTENRKYADKDDEVWVDEDHETFIYAALAFDRQIDDLTTEVEASEKL